MNTVKSITTINTKPVGWATNFLKTEIDLFPDEHAKGEGIVILLGLKECRDSNKKRFDPPRYQTSHGQKTAIGLYRTLKNFYMVAA